MDAVLPVSNSRRLAAMLPGARLVVLPACGHIPQEEEPAAFADAVTAFLKQLPGDNAL